MMMMVVVVEVTAVKEDGGEGKKGIIRKGIPVFPPPFPPAPLHKVNHSFKKAIIPDKLSQTTNQRTFCFCFLCFSKIKK